MAKPEKDLKATYEYIYREGELCHGCEFNQVTRERRPYGDSYVIEPLRCCLVPNIKECPGLMTITWGKYT